MAAAAVRPCSRSDVARRSDSRSDDGGGVGATTIVSVGRAPVDPAFGGSPVWEGFQSGSRPPRRSGSVRARALSDAEMRVGEPPVRTSVPPTPRTHSVRLQSDQGQLVHHRSLRSRSGPRDSSPWLAPRRGTASRGASRAADQSERLPQRSRLRVMRNHPEASRSATSNASAAPFRASWGGSAELAGDHPAGLRDSATASGPRQHGATPSPPDRVRRVCSAARARDRHPRSIRRSAARTSLAPTATGAPAALPFPSASSAAGGQPESRVDRCWFAQRAGEPRLCR